MSADLRTAAWIRVFLIVTAFLALFLIGVAMLLRDSRQPMEEWIDDARDHLTTMSDGRNALSPLIEALDKANWAALQEHREALRDASTDGWRETSDDGLEELLLAHQPVFAAITRSAGYQEISFPITEERAVTMPRPDFESMENFGFLLVANARRLAANGKPGEAAQRLMEAALVGARFCTPEAESTLLGHVIGNALLEMSANALAQILPAPSLADAQLERVAAQLAEMESQRNPIASAVRAEVRNWAREVEDCGENADQLSKVLQLYNTDLTPGDARKLASQFSSYVPLISEATESLWQPVWVEFSKPRQERQLPNVEDLKAATDNPLASFFVPDVQRLAWRGLALVLLGLEAEAVKLRDPFTGQPLQIGERMIWFPGPDGDDDKGGTRFDPGEGPDSDGDLVVRW